MTIMNIAVSKYNFLKMKINLDTVLLSNNEFSQNFLIVIWMCFRMWISAFTLHHWPFLGWSLQQDVHQVYQQRSTVDIHYLQKLLTNDRNLTFSLISNNSRKCSQNQFIVGTVTLKSSTFRTALSIFRTQRIQIGGK